MIFKAGEDEDLAVSILLFDLFCSVTLYIKYLYYVTLLSIVRITSESEVRITRRAEGKGGDLVNRRELCDERGPPGKGTIK